MNVAEKIAFWAAKEPSVSAVVLIGSQSRAREDRVWRADPQSDWDFQIITSDVAKFADARWAIEAGLTPRVYVMRRAAIGGVPKVAALFAEGEADFVLLPAGLFRLGRWMATLGLHRRSAKVGRMFQDLAIIIRPGWQFLKGRDRWEPLYRKIVAEVPDPRLDDASARTLADGFVCDYVWTLRKLERGEYVAAQRMLHHSLAETNLRLMHELRLRRGERSFPEGRRAEFVLPANEVARLMIDAKPEASSLLAATKRAALSCRELMQELVGKTWQWPDEVPS